MTLICSNFIQIRAKLIWIEKLKFPAVNLHIKIIRAVHEILFSKILEFSNFRKITDLGLSQDMVYLDKGVTIWFRIEIGSKGVPVELYGFSIRQFWNNIPKSKPNRPNSYLLYLILINARFCGIQNALVDKEMNTLGQKSKSSKTVFVI